MSFKTFFGMKVFLRAISIFIGLIYVSMPMFAMAKTVEELRSELDAKRKNLKNTEQEIKKFQESIQEKRKTAQTLADQIEIMDDNITEIELTVENTAAQISETDSELESVEADIEVKEKEVELQKQVLAEYIRSIHTLDQQSSVTVFLKYTTFSEALQESSTIVELQNRGHETLVHIQALQDDLIVKQRELEDYRQSLASLRDKQEKQQVTLENQKNSKERILQLTNAQESQYKSLLQEAQQQHKSAESSIAALDTQIREELKKQGAGNLPSVGKFDWPIEPIFGVSCEFHCGGYPYAYLIGPHSAIDIPTYVGTPIKAPADGYVARTHDSGGPGYSYIMIIHGDGLSTVYGHVSGFAAKEGQMVSRGTVIGYTGGASGSHGSGLSSGPHLHFEVRKNNVPVNPRNYL